MQKPFRVASVSVVSVLMLLWTPWLCSQEAGGKDSADKGVAEQKTVEKAPVHPFGERCDPTTCMTKVLYFSNLFAAHRTPGRRERAAHHRGYFTRSAASFRPSLGCERHT
jgi:hypothetical protein